MSRSNDKDGVELLADCEEPPDGVVGDPTEGAVATSATDTENTVGGQAVDPPPARVARSR